MRVGVELFDNFEELLNKSTLTLIKPLILIIGEAVAADGLGFEAFGEAGDQGAAFCDGGLDSGER